MKLETPGQVLWWRLSIGLLWLCAIAGAAIVMLAVWLSGAQAHDMAGIISAAQGDDKRLQWYESLKNGVNTPCCDKNDGHQLREDHTKLVGSQWFVFLEPEGKWAPVPPQALIRTPSIDGQPYLFRMASPVPWSPDGIRCFIPPIPGY